MYVWNFYLFSSLEEKNFLNWDLYYLQSEYFRIISSWCSDINEAIFTN